MVIILRGAMDGLHLLQPYSDKSFKKLRPTLSKMDENMLVHLDGLFALNIQHGGTPLLDLWNSEELSFIQAVSTPYRGTRSHFDGQDILETGGNKLGEHRDGWLVRMVNAINGINMHSAHTLSLNGMLLGQGSPAIPNQSPNTYLSTQILNTKILSELYRGDALFTDALIKAEKFGLPTPSTNHKSITAQITANAVTKLNSNARVVAFSIDGWDTHSSQLNTMKAPLETLGKTLSQLKTGLGINWSTTSVLCLTEFGRTVKENGVGGTDHGTGGMALLAGGAVRGKHIHGKWPGLSQGDLYEGRDLTPTTDIRNYIVNLFSETFAVPSNKLASQVFNMAQLETISQLTL